MYITIRVGFEFEIIFEVYIVLWFTIREQLVGMNCLFDQTTFQRLPFIFHAFTGTRRETRHTKKIGLNQFFSLITEVWIFETTFPSYEFGHFECVCHKWFEMSSKTLAKLEQIILLCANHN